MSDGGETLLEPFIPGTLRCRWAGAWCIDCGRDREAFDSGWCKNPMTLEFLRFLGREDWLQT